MRDLGRGNARAGCRSTLRLSISWLHFIFIILIIPCSRIHIIALVAHCRSPLYKLIRTPADWTELHQSSQRLVLFLPGPFTPPHPKMALHRSKTERKPGNRLMRALTNPNFESLMPKPKDPDPNAKRLEDWKIARAIGARGVDFGLAQPDAGPQLPDADSPLFAVVIDNEVEDKLPRSYNIRSLQRDDWDRGYCQLKVIGDSVTLPQWDERCEWLRQRNDTYVILVITDQHDRVVCTGTLLIERKFTHGMSLVGHVEDLAVDPGQSGKNLGLRMLDALDGVSKQLGCYKTIVFCQESNVGFHAQKGFKKTGVEMVGLTRDRKETSKTDVSPTDPPLQSRPDTQTDGG